MTETQKRLPHLFFRNVRVRRKTPAISLELRPQVHAILSPSVDVGDDLVRCGSGMSLPYRGKVLLGSVQPGKTPELRGRIGTLLRQEPPLKWEGTVRTYLDHVLTLRKNSEPNDAEHIGPEAVPHVTGLLDRAADSLTPKERRLVALGLAMALSKPSLLLLHDPLADLDGHLAHSLVNDLSKRADAGSIVTCIVPTERAAKQLADRVHDLHGRAVKDPRVHFLVRSERVREVASLLTQSSEILSTEVHSKGDLVVGAYSEETAASEITQALCTAQVNVFEVRRVYLPLAENDGA